MEADFKLNDNILYKKKIDLLNLSESNENILYWIYSFGVILRSHHYELAYPKDRVADSEEYRKYVRRFKPQWDIDIWTRVTWGTDDKKEEEEYEADYDKGLEKMPYFDYLITQAVKYNRPAWSIFGLFGMMQGRLNQNAYKVEKYEELTPEDLVRNYRHLPIEFLRQYKEDFMYLFSYFDERGFVLHIDIENIQKFISITEEHKS